MKYLSNESEIAVKFIYPKNQEYFQELREQNPLDLSNLGTIDKVKRIAGYVHNLWSHDGDSIPKNSNPIEIINESRNFGANFRCVEYSVVTSSLLWAYGISSRVVGLKTQDSETLESGAGHAVVEFWNQENLKWIMIDVQAGILLKNKSTYLSCVDLATVIENNEDVNIELLENSNFDIEKENYIKWISKYLYFFDTNIDSSIFPKEEDRYSQEKLLLCPIGVTPPIIFQKVQKLSYVVTHSTVDFYPKMIGVML